MFSLRQVAFLGIIVCAALALTLRAQQPSGAASPGRDLHVHPQEGDDQNSGTDRPFRTIKRAIASAKPGDTIHLAPVRFYESADFGSKRGEKNRPITFAGHGAVLDGSEPIKPEEWSEVAPGLFRKEKLMANFNAAFLLRWYFIWNGEMNHMGRTSKGGAPR